MFGDAAKWFEISRPISGSRTRDSVPQVCAGSMEAARRAGNRTVGVGRREKTAALCNDAHQGGPIGFYFDPASSARDVSSSLGKAVTGSKR